jgi:hypothetical protein
MTKQKVKKPNLLLCKLIAWGWCQQGKVDKKIIHPKSNIKMIFFLYGHKKVDEKKYLEIEILKIGHYI